MKISADISQKRPAARAVGPVKASDTAFVEPEQEEPDEARGSAREPVDPMTDFGDVLHAYAIVESKSEPGRYHALHLEGVMYERAERLAAGHRTNGIAMAGERIASAISARTIRKKWNKP